MFNVVIVAFVGFDVSQEDYVVREILRAVGSGQNDDYCLECRVVRGETDTVAVLFIYQRGGGSAEVVGEIVSNIDECISSRRSELGRFSSFEALWVKMVFTRERSWLRLLETFIFCWIWGMFLSAKAASR